MAVETSTMSAKLATLPPEILAQIVTHIETARAVHRLSLTCKRLHAFVENDGFRVFAQTRFPYVCFPSTHNSSFWRDATHGLTTLARNWDRKAFLGWRINPVSGSSLENRRHKTRTQTMGFVPVIDSYEAWYGGDWSSREEIVAWGSGADLVVRTRTMGNKARDAWKAAAPENLSDFNVHQHRYEWTVYHETGVREGKDDITSLNLLPQDSVDETEQVIIGRASGGLIHVSLSKGTSGHQVHSVFSTEGRPVRSATTNLGSRDLLAACLSDAVIALYPISRLNNRVASIAKTTVIPPGQSGRTWTSQFLSNDRLAVGYGTSQQPIRIYNIGRGEMTSEYSRTLGFNDAGADPRFHTLSDNNGGATSVYSLASIATSSLTGRADGDLFLSGAYDGLCRLHDLRSPNPTVARFRDLVDTFSPIYSLLPIGSERFVAGGARHSILKVFDLRIPGAKSYHSTDLDPCSDAKPSHSRRYSPTQSCCGYHFESKYGRRNWNIFLDIGTKRCKSPESPVYSLSRPSQCSASLYAGIEGTIVQLDMVSIMDQHPDPVFHNGPAKTGSPRDVQRKWDPQAEVACLPMYEHDTGSITLWKQRPVENAEGTIEEWDERWSYLPSHH